jgi:hypothetical protein
MPKIRVEAKDSTQRHLKVLLESLAGSAKLPQTNKSALDYASGRNGNAFSGPALPDINYRDKKQEMEQKEQRDILKSLRQFRTLKDLNDTLMKVPHMKNTSTAVTSPIKSMALHGADSRAE